MNINDDTERIVREAYASVVAGEQDRFEAALRPLMDGEERSRECLELALSIDSVALSMLHEGQSPDPEHLKTLAAAFSKVGVWPGVSTADAAQLLDALGSEEPKEPFLATDLRNALTVTLAVGAWLLADFIKDDELWTTFLDEVLDAIEKAKP